MKCPLVHQLPGGNIRCVLEINHDGDHDFQSPVAEPGQGLTRGIKKDDGKPAIDLIDPEFIEEVAMVLTKGAEKYTANNWQQGMALGKVMGGVLRHCFALLRGELKDPETGLSHAAHATCGLMFVFYYVKRNMLSVPDDRWSK